MYRAYEWDITVEKHLATTGRDHKIKGRTMECATGRCDELAVEVLNPWPYP